MLKKAKAYIDIVLKRNRFIIQQKGGSNLQGKLYIQILAAFAFFTLTVVNLISKSYIMLVLTAAGCIFNLLFAFIAKKASNGRISAISAIITCSVLFGYFIINGGNDGFAALWVVLLPLFSMVAMDFIMGFLTGAFFQTFLFVVFWTPIRYMLSYQYNDEFCNRFPLFFLMTFLLGLLLTLSLQKSEYNELIKTQKLEEMTAAASALARIDPLTQLSNRRFAYEEFEARFTADGAPHCIIMGDIDSFKKINDTFGHKFGDDVLLGVAGFINECLPNDYLKTRWGGEEFLFAANSPINEVYLQIESLRKAIEAHVFDCDGTPVQITITFGIAEYHGKSELNKAISTADDRLFKGKQSKKNCTVTGA